jgi:hypothetical protein
VTLTDAATITKKGFIVFVVLILLSFMGWGGYQFYYHNIYLPSQPKPKPQPDNKFGILPKLVFEPDISTNSAVTSANYTYTLDTKTGALPKDFPELIKVFFIPQLGTTLLAPDRAKALADSFEFNNGPELISETQYRFTDNNEGEFIIDLNTGNFKYTHQLIATDSAQLGPEPTRPTLGDQTQIALEFKNFLSNKELLKEHLTNGPSKVVYQNQDMQDSDFANVSIMQNEVEKIPIITPRFNTGLVRSLVTKYKAESQKYLLLDYTYWPIDLNTYGTYRIKSVDQAFKDLQSGNSVVINPPSSSPVSLTTVYLAYLLGESYNPYLQPVYVFEGPNFVAVVPAITQDLTQ